MINRAVHKMNPQRGRSWVASLLKHWSCHGFASEWIEI